MALACKLAGQREEASKKESKTDQIINHASYEAGATMQRRIQEEGASHCELDSRGALLIYSFVYLFINPVHLYLTLVEFQEDDILREQIHTHGTEK